MHARKLGVKAGQTGPTSNKGQSDRIELRLVVYQVRFNRQGGKIWDVVRATAQKCVGLGRQIRLFKVGMTGVYGVMRLNGLR